MKKLFTVLGIYTVILFAIAIAFGFFMPVKDSILAVDVTEFKFNRGLLWFFAGLPSIVLSGFTVGCCVQWKHGSGASVNRFSPAMMSRFKVVLCFGLIAVLLLTSCHEILTPLIQKNQNQIKNNPAELKQNIILSRHYLNEEEATLAWHYAELAYGIDPTDPEASELYAKTHIAMEKTLQEIRMENRPVEKIELPLAKADELYSPKMLMEKSEQAKAQKNWFDAHYWASLAVKGSNSKDLIHETAIAATNYAWNRLRESGDFDNDDEREYYTLKRDAYSAFNASNYLKAYYLFLNLQKRNQERGELEDPDVTRYLALSQEQVENQHFFIDETSGMDKTPSERDIYFSVTQPAMGTLVFFINRCVSVQKTGGYVRYMQDLYMVSYDNDGNFQYTLHVPFAKGLAVSADYFDEETKNILGIKKGMKYILELQLVSVDRETEGIISNPEVSYIQTGLSEENKKFLEESNFLKNSKSGKEYREYLKKTGTALPKTTVSEEVPKVIFIPIEFNDFATITEVSHGSKNMNLLHLNNFISKCENYGYSSEIFIQSLVSRGSYPLLLLCFIVFAASLAWNYRFEDENAIFKFRWIFLMPVLFVITFVFFETATYVCNVFIFVIVGMFGGLALIVTFLVLIVILFILSIVFLSRKAD